MAPDPLFGVAVGGLVVWALEAILAPQIPTQEPSFVRIGDSWIWNRTLGDYPSAEGWTIAYQIRGVQALVWSAGYVTAVGSTYSINIPAAATAALDAGAYQWVLVATGSGTYAGQRRTVDYGRFTVAPDAATAAAGDFQSFAEQMVSKLKVRILATADTDIISYTIGNRQVVRSLRRELENQLRKYEWQIFREQNPGQIGATVVTGFSVPGGAGGPYQSGIIERYPWVMGNGPN